MSSDKATPPEAVLRQLFMGLRASQVAYVAAKLALADHLANQPMSSAQLAAATSADPASLRRILRALVALGVLAETDTDAFALTPVGHLLRTDHPGSLRAVVLFMTGDVRWRCWGDLLESVRTGEPATQRVLGMSAFEFYAANPEVAEIHAAAMAARPRCLMQRSVRPTSSPSFAASSTSAEDPASSSRTSSARTDGFKGYCSIFRMSSPTRRGSWRQPVSPIDAVSRQGASLTPFPLVGTPISSSKSFTTGMTTELAPSLRSVGKPCLRTEPCSSWSGSCQNARGPARKRTCTSSTSRC